MTALTWDDLVTAATVGLSRRPLEVTGLAAATDYADVLDRDDPAAALLDAAALVTGARQAGARPLHVTGPTSAAATDTAPELTARAAMVLAQAGAADASLLADLLTAAGQAGYRAPVPLLAVLLDAATKDRSLRSPVTAVLGARGRWLAGHHPGWRWVTDATPMNVRNDPRVWQTGTRAERRGYLVSLRGRDPAAATELLAAGWADETGDDRADWLSVLAHELSDADEPFLESSLEDRKTSVRATAARLLGQLPGSAFTRRASERAAGVLRVEPHGQRQRLAVRLPEADDAARRDGIGTSAPPSARIGAGAWLLTQTIAAAPLALWVTRFGLDPAQIVSLPVERGLAPDVHAGWRLATVRQADARWAQALLTVEVAGTATARPPMAWPPDAGLAALLAPRARAERAARLITGPVSWEHAVAEVCACPGPWPDSLALAVLDALRREATHRNPSRLPKDLVSAAARNVPVTGQPDYAGALARLAIEGSAPWTPALRRAAETIVSRRTFLEEIR